MAIGAIGAGIPLPPVNPTPTSTPSVSSTGGNFGDLVSNAVENLQQVQGTADNLAVQAASGQLTDVHDYMIAATQANLATELTVAVRNKAVEAFNQIMGMPI